ncbi:MAG TPA: stimulus-sensing domain-containing protein [Caulobacteraceae bacterium]|nr:stimulus-sensing domain-containing protein [Caulobacteraceae bacterium]
MKTGDPAPPRVRRLPIAGSRLGRLILVLNLLGLTILVAGALVLNEMAGGLVQARIDSLTTQGEFIANVLEQAATRGDPEPVLEPDRARDVLRLLFIPTSQRARLFNAAGQQIADSEQIADKVEQYTLPPARKPGAFVPPWRRSPKGASAEALAKARAALVAEAAAAQKGAPVAGIRRSETGSRLVSVSVPIQHVQAVLGVLTLEAGDVDQIVAAQRRALVPFILIAVAVILGSSLLLNWLIAHPILRLATAADRVRLSRARAISLPDIAQRKDEVGDLARSLEAMTSALSARMDAIERFAADVAHEIKNPLTSLRSAVETLDLGPSPEARARLGRILKQDVNRMDRLITDISNASRLDAELSRESPRTVDIGRLLFDIASLYGEPRGVSSEHAQVRMEAPASMESFKASGREGPLGQVFRNLIDNARSFSPSGGGVIVKVRRDRGREGAREVVVTVEDDGPGIPPENLETVFERFYTARPKGAAFGGHSGLGLSIARQIVEAHGGRISAENRTGPDGSILGARFTVALPEART